jgi:acetyl-CoA C-acetyltransferase
MIESNTPVLVGCADITDTATPFKLGRSPYDLIAQAARLALADPGAAGLAKAIDTVAMLRSYADTSHRFATRLGSSRNPPKSIARRLGLEGCRHVYTWSGGNMPQYLVNEFAEAISRREMSAALVVGGEALRTQYGVERGGLDVSWSEDPGGEPELIGDERPAWSAHEDRHNMRAAITFFPLFENAIRAARGRSIPEHMLSMGRLMAHFAGVAANNPRATRRDGFSAERLTTVDAENRWIGFPYPRLMIANAYIDQAAALVMTSVGTAKSLGIPESKWVYLHGCADAHDHWFVSEKIDYHSSPAMRAGASRALDMAGRKLGDIEFFDIYSCFSSAVEIACAELGLAEDDPRGLTVTGGLPYFGGPGNSYVVHSICEMMRRMRAKPGSYGLVTGNGNWVTKQSHGLYSTAPIAGPWQRERPAVLQSELDALPKPAFTERPSGRAVIETYTVMHGRRGPEFGVVVGRLDATGERFVANTPCEAAVLESLQEREGVGRPGTVEHRDGHNTFTPH